ncbi:hypothetical protein Tco_1164592 [Tanacetum coccineum]
MLLDKGFEARVWYVIGVATLRALVRAGDQTSGDARCIANKGSDMNYGNAFVNYVLYVTTRSACSADEAQSSRVPVPLLDDPYVAVRQVQLVDTKSELEEAPSKVEELQCLGSRIPLMGKEFVIVDSSGTRTHSSHSSASSDSTAPLSPDNPLTHVSPTPTPTCASFYCRTARMTMRAQPVMSPGHSARVTKAMALSDLDFCKRYRSSYETPSSSSSLALPVRKRYKGTSELILDTDSDEDEQGDEDSDEDREDKSLDTDDKREGLDDEDHGLDDEGHSLDEEGLSLEGSEEEAVHEGQQQASLIVETAVGSGSVPELERPERVSALRQPILTTLIGLEDGIAYIDVPAYLPPTPPSQIPPSPEWSSGLLPVSPAPSVIPLPIPSLMISLIVPLASPVSTLTATISIDEDQFIEVGHN